MVERAYMVIDWRADHSFRVPRPDLTAEIGTPNACSNCHSDKPLQWSLDAYRRWYGEARRPHFATTFAAARRGDPAAQPELVRIAGSELQSPIVRATALELLAAAPRPEGNAVLRAALDSDEALLRQTAAAHLPLETMDDVARLAPLLSDPVKAVRMATVARLAIVPRERLKPYQQEAMDAAIAEYREAMTYGLDFPSSNYNLGNLEAALGHPKEAEHYYRAALKIDDLFFPAQSNLAVLLSGQGRNDEAEALLREILRDYPENRDAMYSLGLLLVELDRADEGLTWLMKAAEARPSDARAQYNLGLLLQQMGRIGEAEQALKRALELEPTRLDYLYAYADHLLRRGRLEEARALAERMIELHPDEPIGHQMKAVIEQAQR